MSVTEDIKNYAVLAKEAEELLSEVSALREKSSAVRESAFARLVFEERIRLMKEKAERANEALFRAEKAMDALQPFDRRLIRLRYISGYSWVKVGRILYLSPDSARNRGRAILAGLDTAEGERDTE